MIRELVIAGVAIGACAALASISDRPRSNRRRTRRNHGPSEMTWGEMVGDLRDAAKTSDREYATVVNRMLAAIDKTSDEAIVRSYKPQNQRRLDRMQREVRSAQNALRG